MSVNAAIMAPLVLDGIAPTRMAFRLQMYTANTYCMLGKDHPGKAPVLLVYIVLVCKAANAVKQNMLWVEHSSLVGWRGSMSERA
jgi:hypothetical protein